MGAPIKILEPINPTPDNYIREVITNEEIGDDHIEDDDLEMFASEISNMVNLKSFNLLSRSHGRYGYYKVRDIKSLQEILKFASSSSSA